MNTHTVDWPILKKRWLSIADGERWDKQPDVSDYFMMRSERFSGGSVAQTAEWVRDGYDLPSFTGGTVQLTPSKRRRPMWSEDEGQIDRTRLLCGDEAYRLTREPRAKPRAAKVEIGYGFLGEATAKVIGQYGLWCAGLIRKLEAEGLDVQVDIVSRSSSYIREDRELCELHLRVQRENERSNLRSWSAIFAPTGHRHLMFCARAIHADDQNRTCNTGFGGSRHRGWKVSTDGETIYIDCDSAASNQDPTAILTTQARAAGLL